MESGPMPCDVMLDAMRHHYGRVQAERLKPKPATALITKELAIAQGYARDAAPYYHPRLAALATNIPLNGRLTLEQLITASMALPANANAEAAMIDVTPKVEETNE